MAAMTEPSAVSTNAPPVAPASDLPPPAFPSALAAALLSAPPPPNMIATRLDFFSTPLPEYAGLYAAVIDSALTAAECAALVSLAESTTDPPATWEQALVNVGGGRQTLLTDVRRCGRIIWDSRAVAAALWARVEGLVGAGVAQARTALDAPGGDAGGLGIARVRGEPRVTGRGPVERGETWRMTRLNERLRFLRYEEGDYFRRELGSPTPPTPGRERLCDVRCGEGCADARTGGYSALRRHVRDARRARAQLLHAAPVPLRDDDRGRVLWPPIRHLPPSLPRRRNLLLRLA